MMEKCVVGFWCVMMETGVVLQCDMIDVCVVLQCVMIEVRVSSVAMCHDGVCVLCCSMS